MLLIQSAEGRGVLCPESCGLEKGAWAAECDQVFVWGTCAPDTCKHSMSSIVHLPAFQEARAVG